MPMNVYDANIPMNGGCGGCNGAGMTGTFIGGTNNMHGGNMQGGMSATVGTETHPIDAGSSVMGESGAMDAADSAVDITGEAVEAIEGAVQAGGGN